MTIIEITIEICFLAWFGWALSELTLINRNPDHRLHSVVRACHIALALPLLL